MIIQNKSAQAINPATQEQLDKLVGLEIPAHDYLTLTYVTAGNGIGKIETVTYKVGGSGGTIVATLTLSYDGNNNLISITKS